MCRGGPRKLRGYGDLRLCAQAAGRGLRLGGMGATDEALAVRALAPNAAGCWRQGGVSSRCQAMLSFIGRWR